MYAKTLNVNELRLVKVSFDIHTFNFNCFLDDFTCVFTQIRCLSWRTSGLPDAVYAVFSRREKFRCPNTLSLASFEG